jgi:hypothetical protein
MGAVEHLKTLCCLGLKPESAMLAVTPLLDEIIPHGWTRIWRMAPDATCTRGYGEHPETGLIFRERLWTFAKDPSSPVSLLFGPALITRFENTIAVQGTTHELAPTFTAASAHGPIKMMPTAILASMGTKHLNIHFCFIRDLSFTSDRGTQPRLQLFGDIARNDWLETAPSSAES